MRELLLYWRQTSASATESRRWRKSSTARVGIVAARFSISMLVNTQSGDTYSFEEIAGWLAEAGFVDTRQLESPGPSPLILARKPLEI